MAVWAIADLHLSFGTPNKLMDVFGERWVNHASRLKQHWEESVHPDDLVLLPGDISWAMRLEAVKPDLEWIHALPGTKIMIRGNHDYWWTSLSKIEQVRPPTIHYLQNNAILWNDVAIAGTRLWDCADFAFDQLVEDANGKPWTPEMPPNVAEDQRIFARELLRLEISLKEMAKLDAKVRIAMTHYPPIDTNLKPSPVADLLEKYKVDFCVFGHLHNARRDLPIFGKRNAVTYLFTAGDYLDFRPLKVLA